MNVLLLTMDEPMYMPQYLQPILEEYADEIEEVVIAPHPGEDLVTTARQRFEMFGPRAFLRYGFHFGLGLILRMFPSDIQHSMTGRYHSVPSLCDAYDIFVRVEEDVNRRSFVDQMVERDLDLILSIACGQKVGSELLSIPTKEAINLHGSLLPKYRGRATAFWVLYHDEEYSGVTAHYMTDEFDGGDIVAQRRFPISDDDTMHDVYMKIVSTGADLARDVIEQVRNGTVETDSNLTGEGEYRGLPDSDDRVEFLERGNAFR